MRNAGKIVVLMSFVMMSASGCKKKFDPNDFDGGASALASASAAASTTPPVDSSAATDTGDAGDGLAPLVEGKTHTASAGGGATKPKGDPPECVQAREWCNTKPPAERHSKEGQKNCSDFRFACFNKGGHI
jgi:hypothetical protein